MINSINPYNLVNGVQLQNNVPNAPVQVTNNGISQVENPNLNGINALANYNRPINTPRVLTKTPMTIAKPTDIQNIKGEKVTSSDGSLQAIVDKGENSTTIYKMNGDKVVENIKTYDNATGNLIKCEYWDYSNEDNERNGIPAGSIVDEYDKQTGKPIKSTYQDFVKPEYSGVTEIETLPDGSTQSYSIDSNRSSISETYPNGDNKKITEFDPSGQIKEIRYYQDDVESKVVTYRNGIPAKIEDIQRATYSPEVAQIPANDPNMTPAQPFVLGYNPTEVQGEKKYYSNGQLESIKTQTANGTVYHNFDVRGKLTEITSNENGVEKRVKFNGDNDRTREYSIIENLDKDTQKETNFFVDGMISVHTTNEVTHETTSATYNPNGKIRTYYKFNKESNTPSEDIFIEFDKNGNVVEARI